MFHQTLVMFTTNCHPVLSQYGIVYVVSMELAGIIQSSDKHYIVDCDRTGPEANFITIAGTDV